jgi:hypothetical protein
MKGLSKAGLGLVAICVLTGCGGGGSGGATTPVNGQSASIVAAQGAVLYEGALASTEAAIRSSNVPTAVTPMYAWIGQEASRAFISTREPASWTLIPGTSLYFKAGSVSGASTTLLLSTDGATNNAGFVKFTLASFPGVYPATIDITSSVILPGQTISGTGAITLDDSTGKNFRLSDTESSSISPVSTAVTITETNGNPAVTLTVKEGSVTVLFATIQSSSSGLTATITAGGLTGDVQLNADGSGESQATDSLGTWTVTWDANENATITSPSGAKTTGSLESFRS